MSDETADPDDDRLLAELRRAARGADPVPEHVQALARAAYDWRTLDEELAELVADTAVQDPELALVRSGEAEVLMSFAAGELSVELEVRATPAGRRLTGQLLPPQRADVRLERPSGALALHADDLGRFSAAGLPPGPARLVVEPAAGTRRVATPWMML